MKITTKTIENLEKLIISFGWMKTLDKPNYPFVVFKNEEYKSQLTIPRKENIEYDDAMSLIENALEDVSRILVVEINDLKFKLENPEVTTLEIRYDSSNTTSGTIPTQIMESLSKQIPRLISDTYLNMKNKLKYRKVFPSNSKYVNEIAKNIRFGQTKVGSYVVTVHVDSIIEQSDDGGFIDGSENYKIDDNNLSYEAIKKSISSLNEVIDTVDSTYNDEELDTKLRENVSEVSKSLSVNFTEALSKIELEDDAKLEVVGYSPLIVNNEIKINEKIVSRQYSKPVKENLKTFIKNYKINAKEEASYIGKFTGFDTKNTEPSERNIISAKFQGYNTDDENIKTEKLVCEISYNEEMQDRINEYIKNGNSLKVTGEKEKKKLINIAEIIVID